MIGGFIFALPAEITFNIKSALMFCGSVRNVLFFRFLFLNSGGFFPPRILRPLGYVILCAINCNSDLFGVVAMRMHECGLKGAEEKRVTYH